MTKNLLQETRLSLGDLATHQYRYIQYAMANELTVQVARPMSSPVQCPMTKNLLPEKKTITWLTWPPTSTLGIYSMLTGQVSGMFKAFADLATDQYIRQSVLNNRPLVEGLTDEALAGGPSDDGALAPDD